MQPIRRLRLQAVLLNELSRMIPQILKDPRIPKLTFTHLEVNSDGSQAIAYFSLFGKDKKDLHYAQDLQETLKGLGSASGFLKRKLAKVLSVKTIPYLVFKPDQGLENTSKVHELLKQLS